MGFRACDLSQNFFVAHNFEIQKVNFAKRTESVEQDKGDILKIFAHDFLMRQRINLTNWREMEMSPYLSLQLQLFHFCTAMLVSQQKAANQHESADYHPPRIKQAFNLLWHFNAHPAMPPNSLYCSSAFQPPLHNSYWTLLINDAPFTTLYIVLLIAPITALLQSAIYLRVTSQKYQRKDYCVTQVLWCRLPQLSLNA